MPTNAFPKSYIIERIAARKASLQSKVDAGTKAAADWEIIARPKLLESLQAAAESAKKTADLAAKRAKEAKTADWDAEQIRIFIGQSEERRSTRDTFPTIQGGSTWGFREYETKLAEHRKLFEAGNAAQRELDKLEHAEAYFVETPVDEFTITGLKQLGLLDAVKFDLGAGQAKRA